MNQRRRRLACAHRRYADDHEMTMPPTRLKLLDGTPAPCMLLLLSNTPGRFCPPSLRCQRLELRPWIHATLEQGVAQFRPDVATGRARFVGELSGGSRGAAFDACGR